MAESARILQALFDHLVACQCAYHNDPSDLNLSRVIRAKQERAKALVEFLLGGKPEWYENL